MFDLILYLTLILFGMSCLYFCCNEKHAYVVIRIIYFICTIFRRKLLFCNVIQHSVFHIGKKIYKTFIYFLESTKPMPGAMLEAVITKMALYM